MGGKGEGNYPPPLNFELTENCRKIFCLRNILSKNAKIGAEKPSFLGKFGGKIEILSTHA